MSIENHEMLLRKADEASKSLISKASEDARALLIIAAEAAIAAVADEENAEAAYAAKALLSKAADDAKDLLSKAVDDAKELLSIATETAEELLARVKLLEGIIPICMHCKKIRNEHETWEQIEKYISQHSDAMFSHGICPECVEKHYPDMEIKSRKVKT